MSVYIRLIRNNIKSSSSYGKYFAKAVSQGEVTLDEIAAEACRNSGFSEGSVIGVATEIQDIMKQRLREGQTVVLRFPPRRPPYRRRPDSLRPLRRCEDRLAKRLQALKAPS